MNWISACPAFKTSSIAIIVWKQQLGMLVILSCDLLGKEKDCIWLWIVLLVTNILIGILWTVRLPTIHTNSFLLNKLTTSSLIHIIVYLNTSFNPSLFVCYKTQQNQNKQKILTNIETIEYIKWHDYLYIVFFFFSNNELWDRGLAIIIEEKFRLIN